jgi:hemolysin III
MRGLMSAAATPLARLRVKPKLRGVSHEIAFYVAIVATAALVATAHGLRAQLAAAVYGASLSALFGISALYHRKTWAPEPRRIMRRVDHSAIYLLIAGTYTPLFWLLDVPETHHRPLFIVWIGAALGIGKSMLWPHAPKALTAGLYVILGWAVVGDVIRLRHIAGSDACWLLVIGGVIYSVGALVYARKKPDPIPEVFGYHEIFHLIVIVASMVHFAHVVRVLRVAG